jgi:foldase protein PrsA
LTGLLLLGLLAAFWYKTNTWPIAAVVNGRPITRFEVDQALYKQSGKDALQNMIDERLIRSEISKNGVQVSDDEINKRVDEIKISLGQNFDSALAAQGLTATSLKDQIRVQLSLEKLLSDKATVSAEEVKKLSPNEADAESAAKYLKQQKLQEAISSWIADLRTKAKIFIVGQK